MKGNKLKAYYKVFAIFIYFTFFSSFTYSQTGIKNLQSEINELIDDPFFEKTIISLNIFDLTDSISLYQKNEKLLLRPASNMKILTSVTALLNLGPDYEFKTDLYHTGIIEKDILYGDLYVVGGFDPDFTTEDIDSLVRITQSLGIKEIDGGIYADVSGKDSLYWGEGWMWTDDSDPSSPYLSSLNINDNSIEVFVEGTEPGLPAKVTLIPRTDYVEVVNNAVTVSYYSSDDFKVKRDIVNKSNRIYVEGEVRKTSVIDTSKNTEKISMLFPEIYFLTLFKERLEEAGINVKNSVSIKDTDDNSVYLASIRRGIDTVLSDLNKESDNLNAEMLVYAIAQKDSGAPAVAENGLAAIRKTIETLGFAADDFNVADGSGVSHYNLISTELILEALKYMYYERSDLFDLFYNSLAVAGVDGTLEKRMKNTSAEGNVHGKTGTLMGVSNVSGFVTAKNGHLIAFSIMIQNFVEQYSKARSFQDRICILLSEYE